MPVRLKYLPLENHVSSTALVSGKDGPMALPENARVIFPAGNKEISIRRGVLPGNGSRYYIQPGVLPLRTTIRSHTGSKFYEFSFYLKDGKELMVKNSGQAKLKKVIVKPNGAMTRDPRIDPARYWQTQGLEDKDTIKISLYGQELVIQNRKGILYLVKALSLSSKFVEFEDLGGEKFQLSQQLSGAPTFVTPNDLVKVYPDEAMTTDQAINAGDNIFPFSSSADERTLQTIGRRLDKAREELDSAPSLSKERREVLLRELEQGQTHLKQYSLGGRGVQFEIYWRAAHLIRRAEFYMVELMRQGVPDEVVKRLEQEDNEVFKRGFKFTSDEKRMLALEMMGWAVGSAVAAFDLPHSFSTSSEVYFWLAFVIAGSGILTIKKRSNIKRDRIIFRGDSARKEFRDFINVNREITKEKRERGVFLLHKIERLLRYLKYFGYNRQKAEKIAERHLVLDQDGRFPKHVLNVFNRAWYQTVLRRGATISDDLLNNVEFMVHHSAGRVFGPDQAMAGDKAVTVPVATNGGIDLNAEKINWNIRKDGNGVEMNVNPALIERIKREGIESLTPVILRITPITSVWSLIGLAEPAPVSGIS